MASEKCIKKEKKNSNKLQFKKPSRFVWFVYSLFCKFVMFFSTKKITYDRKVLKERNKDEGAIVIYNHTCNKDQYITGATAGNDRFTYVVSRYYTLIPVVGTFLKIVRAISKEQFRSDLASIRKMKRATDNKGVLCIAPAGQTTLHGEMTYVDNSIVKLLKLCKVDVYNIKIEGGYLNFPKWRTNKKGRKSVIHSTTGKVLTKEEIASMTDEEVYQKVVEALNVSEHEYRKENGYLVKSKNIIEGLENVLYVCPKCKEKHVNESKQNVITCSHCGNAIYMDNLAAIHPVNEDDVCFENETVWYNWQGTLLKKRILSDDFIQQNEFTLCTKDEKTEKMVESGKGILTLTKETLFYDGTYNGETIHKDFNLEILTQLPFNPSHHFEIPDGDGIYQFRPTDKKSIIVEWVQIIDVINEIKRSNI